jgi:hypothetical protein
MPLFKGILRSNALACGHRKYGFGLERTDLLEAGQSGTVQPAEMGLLSSVSAVPD